MNRINLSYELIEKIEIDNSSIFPDDILDTIFSILPQNDLLSCSLVNRNWYQISLSNHLWQPIVIRKFPTYTSDLEFILDWKKLYISESMDRANSSINLILNKIDQQIPNMDFDGNGSKRSKYICYTCTIGYLVLLTAAVFLSVLTVKKSIINDINHFNSTVYNSTDGYLTSKTATYINLGFPVLLISCSVCSLIAIISLNISKFIYAYLHEDRTHEMPAREICHYTSLKIRDNCSRIFCNIL